MRTTYPYILSLFCLLATLAPAAQAQETKAKPSDPAFPYTLTVTQPTDGATLAVTIPGENNAPIPAGQTVYNGTQVTLTLTVSKGYRFKTETLKYNDIVLQPAEADGEAGHTYTASFTMPGTAVTVTAQVEIQLYDITYHLDEGTNFANAPETYTVKDAINLGSPTKGDYYIFAGWFTDDAFTTGATSIPSGSTGDIALYAKWRVTALDDIQGEPADILRLPEGTKATTLETVTDTLSTLWKNFSCTNENGKLLTSAIEWKLKAESIFAPDSGKRNEFQWKTVDFPDEIARTGSTIVINYAPVLKPKKDDEIKIIGENTLIKGKGNEERFNGLIEGSPGDTIKTLTLEGPASAASTEIPLTLNNVATDNLIISENTVTNLELTGTTSLGEIKNNGRTTLQIGKDVSPEIKSILSETGSTLIIISADNQPIQSLAGIKPQIASDASLTDYTGSILEVHNTLGGILLQIAGQPSNATATPSQEASVTLQCKVGDGEDYTLTYTLQILSNGTWTTVETVESNTTGIFRIPSDKPGTYRIQVKAEAKKNAPKSSLRAKERAETSKPAIILHSHPVVVKAGPDPTPPPVQTFYSVTLPVLTGAITSPAAGSHSVTAGDSFSFTLTLDAGYNQCTPVVTVNGKTLTPAPNGKYTISNINADITVVITGIVRNAPTGIEQIANDTAIRTEGGALLIRTPVSVTAQVIALTGSVVRKVQLPAGDSRLEGLASGIYIVRLSTSVSKKVIIR